MAEQPATTLNTGKQGGLRGVFPVLSTPFHPDESIDEATLDEEIEWLVERGVDGVVLAMVSEILRLAIDEREVLAERICRRAEGRVWTVISVGAECSRLADRLARHAEANGADALMAIPPVSVALDELEIHRYYERIIEATRLPLIIQDASGYVGRPLSLKMQAGLLAAWGDRVLFKPEAMPIGPRLTALLEMTAGRARVFEGTGGLTLLDSFRRGVVGTMPGPEIVDAIIALWRSLECCDERRAYELWTAIIPIIVLQNSLDAFIAVEKHLLVRRGVFRNQVIRGPVGFTLDPETIAEIDRLYARLMCTLGRAS